MQREAIRTIQGRTGRVRGAGRDVWLTRLHTLDGPPVLTGTLEISERVKPFRVTAPAAGWPKSVYFVQSNPWPPDTGGGSWLRRKLRFFAGAKKVSGVWAGHITEAGLFRRDGKCYAV